MREIFGEDLFEKNTLSTAFQELIGVLPNKPFECVGSRDEVLSALSFVTNKMISNGKKLPFLLDYFNSLNISHTKDIRIYMDFYDTVNHIPEYYENKLKSELKRIKNVF